MRAGKFPSANTSNGSHTVSVPNRGEENPVLGYNITVNNGKVPPA
jgi:hypothetical protein